MAEEKKEDKKQLTHLEEVYLLLIILACVGAIWWRVEEYAAYYAGGIDNVRASIVAYFYTHIVPFLRFVGLATSLLALWGIIYANRKLSAIKAEEEEIYGKHTSAEDKIEPAQKNEKWERVIAHVNSANSSDWRLAVLEADIMLDDLLRSMGYHGDSLGERLKGIEKGDMLTLDNAWEAHRVRNQIAHQGADYPLSEREAKRAIALYESVFKEYRII